MDEERLNQLINAIVSLAELAYLHYQSCINAGANDEVAMRLTEIFINATLSLAQRFEPEED